MDLQKARSDDELVFVDVRESHEWAAGHIDGATHIPMGQITARVDDFDPEARYVAVCRTGARSGRVTGFLQGQGVDIENLEGGMKDWHAAGYPMVSENGTPPRVA